MALSNKSTGKAQYNHGRRYDDGRFCYIVCLRVQGYTGYGA